MTRGRIELIRGPMFSGKTDALIQKLRKLEKQGSSVMAVKPAIDVRQPSDSLESHSGMRYPANEISEVAELENLGAQSEVIALDEAQFWGEGLVDVVLRLKDLGRYVLIAGLDFDYRRDSFATVTALSLVADSVETRRSTCAVCGRPAEFTQRVRYGRPAPADEPQICVGGADLYEPRCRRCHEDEDAARNPAAQIGH